MVETNFSDAQIDSALSLIPPAKNRSADFDPSGVERLAPGIDGALRAFLAVCDVQPRPYQSRIIQSAIRMFAGTRIGRNGQASPAAKSVLIESPTGSGKTVMGLATAALIQRVTGARVGWVAMRRNLLAQAQAENLARGFGLQMHPISMFDKNPPDVDLLVVDEAQHDAATSMANLHSQIRPTWTLGLSATPYRTDRIKLCFDQVIRDAGIASLIADGYLSHYHHYTIPEHTPARIAQLLVDDPKRWGKSLVFFHRRSECDLLYLLLDQADIRSEVVTASSNRERQIADFTEGRLDVLINMAILTEGFDCPELQTVFCRPSGKGCTIQMSGRVLRTCHAVPNKQIVQCRKTPFPMLRMAMPAEQYLWTDDGWRSIRANKQLDAMTHMARQRVAKAEVQLPKLVSIHRSRATSAWVSQSQS
ncbi:DEAD/DEAH box helicase [Planctomycetes bacterium K23_9]|uniref:ATP-dependent RNA helicase SrmB n=1 Tax=Stieleria marina TaxID=1930275 RepID=A0A517P1X3_9BACT|nr:ATP-dependent RNA helicase SrmB [Planctomycetes bacterium K23_9]